jgi:succinyl-CoA synthetase beta subunit
MTPALSEYESKRLLAQHDIPVVPERLCATRAEALDAARTLGLPVALKGCHATIQHKTEMDMVRLGLADEAAVAAAHDDLAARLPAGGGVLVQPMLRGRRELLAGLVRDPQFGPCVSLGLGGVFAEALEDVTFRIAPFDHAEARRMCAELRGQKLLGPFRGEPPVDLDALAAILVALGRIGLDHAEVAAIDINPLIVVAGQPIAADALVLLAA